MNERGARNQRQAVTLLQPRPQSGRNEPQHSPGSVLENVVADICKKSGYRDSVVIRLGESFRGVSPEMHDSRVYTQGVENNFILMNKQTVYAYVLRLDTRRTFAEQQMLADWGVALGGRLHSCQSR